jgi:hypothetical protein
MTTPARDISNNASQVPKTGQTPEMVLFPLLSRVQHLKCEPATMAGQRKLLLLLKNLLCQLVDLHLHHLPMLDRNTDMRLTVIVIMMNITTEEDVSQGTVGVCSYSWKRCLPLYLLLSLLAIMITIEFNAIQSQISSTNINAARGLQSDNTKQLGGLHMDGSDNPLGFSMVINLTNYPEYQLWAGFMTRVWFVEHEFSYFQSNPV